MPKSRDELVGGVHAVRLTLEADPVAVLELWIDQGVNRRRRDSSLGELLGLAEAAGIVVQQVPRKTLDKLLPGVRHQGVALRRRVRRQPDADELIDQLAQNDAALVLILDGIEDPQNLGACFRSADAAGASAIVVPRRGAAGLTPTVHKVAAGAAEVVPFVQVGSLSGFISALQTVAIQVVGTVMDAPGTIYQQDFRGPSALVLGNEGGGIRPSVAAACDSLASLPMFGRTESLNVASSAAVCLFEVVRQRRFAD